MPERENETPAPHAPATPGAPGALPNVKPTASQPRQTPARPPARDLPRWKVLLHNDDVNDIQYVVDSVRMIAKIEETQAILRVTEAHRKGVSLLLATHQERAELFQQQFTSRKITVTIEPEPL